MKLSIKLLSDELPLTLLQFQLAFWQLLHLLSYLSHNLCYLQQPDSHVTFSSRLKILIYTFIPDPLLKQVET